MGNQMPEQARKSGSEAPEARLLALIAGLLRELKPAGSHFTAIDLDSALDRDLGFDSLSRVELMLRIERNFGIHLPEQVLGQAESPRDLLRAIQAAPTAAGAAMQAPRRTTAPSVGGYPASARTLPEMLEWHVNAHSPAAGDHLR